MDNTERERVSGQSGMCDLGERLVEKSLTVGANGRLIEHISACPRCKKEIAA